MGRTMNFENPTSRNRSIIVRKPGQPDRDDLLQRPAPGPAGQRRRGQRGDVGPLGGVGQADPEVLGADGPPVLGRHLVDHRLAGGGVAGRAEGGDPPVGQPAAALQRGGHVAAQPDVEGVLDRPGRDGDVGEGPGRPVVADRLAGPQAAQHGQRVVHLRARGRRVGMPMALRSPPTPEPGTKVRRKRPPESTSSVATALASQTRLRPGSSMVVPILSPGRRPKTQASPTSGSGPGRVRTSGSHSESNPVSAIPRANAAMSSGPRLSPPALMPMRTFTARRPARRTAAAPHRRRRRRGG